MSENLVFASLLPAHAEILAVLHAASFPKPWPKEAFLRLLSDGPRLGVLALNEEAPAGFILVQALPDECEILTLAVEPAHRRMGIGRRLMEWAIKDAGRSGRARVILEVSERNLAARRLYAGLGFEGIAERSDYYARPGTAEKAFLLALPLGCSAGDRQVD